MADRQNPIQLGSRTPRSVEQITNASQLYEYNAQAPLRNWLRTASAILKEAEAYMREGDEETTYLLLFRHAHLILGNLQAHTEASTPAGQTQLAQAKKDVSRNLKILDLLKPRINQRYERYQAILRERKERHKTEHNGASRIEAPPSRSATRQLYGHENSELAVELAHRERHRRAGARNDEPGKRAGQDDISSQVRAIQMLVEKRHAVETSRSDIAHDSSSSYSYPSVRNHQNHDTLVPRTYETSKLSVQSQGLPGIQPPMLPPKDRVAGSPLPPTRPAKIGLPENDSPTITTAEPAYTFAPAATLENGTPLRTLFLPPTLRTTFLRIAHANTLANLETCAFLAGTLISNALFVSKLIVPAQIATSDTCEMTNESQLFDYVDNEKDLMIVGWIHTHPSQTCFMSSRDLHTHAGYQMMLAESIAIVCAPSKGDTSHGGDWGAYRLTDPPGKMAILNCDRPGIFHPHDVDNVYTDALRPGHVVEASGLEFEVIDLRTSS